MQKRIEDLQAEAADAADDAEHGRDKRGDELPGWVADREKRIAKIRAAQTKLEAEAKAMAEEERPRRAEADARREAEGRKRPGKEAAPVCDQPAPKAQKNFTDPESRIMKSKDGYVQAYVVAKHASGMTHKPPSTQTRRSSPNTG